MSETIIASSFLIILLCIFRFLFRRNISMRLRYALWGLVAIRLIIPVYLFNTDYHISSQFSIMNIVDRIDEEKIQGTKLEPIVENIKTGVLTIVENSNDPVIKAASIDWQLVIMVIWVSGTIIITSWMFYINRRFSKELLYNRTLINNGISHVDYNDNIKKFPVDIYTVPGISSPCFHVIHGKPAVYLSPELLQEKDKLEYILAHELYHYKHLDHIWSLVRCGLLAIYWMNPFIWVAALLSKIDCELACDEGAIEFLGEEKRIPYGKTLLQLISENQRVNEVMYISTTMSTTKRTLKERIQMIANKRKMIASTKFGVVLCVIIILNITFTSSKTLLEQESSKIEDNIVDINIFEPEVNLSFKVVNVTDKDYIYINTYGIENPVKEDFKKVQFSILVKNRIGTKDLVVDFPEHGDIQNMQSLHDNGKLDELGRYWFGSSYRDGGNVNEKSYGHEFILYVNGLNNTDIITMFESLKVYVSWNTLEGASLSKEYWVKDVIQFE